MATTEHQAEPPKTPAKGAPGAEIEPALSRLREWVEARDYTGYDLYDGLTMTNREAVVRNYWANTLITQIFKKSPVNLRPLLGMPKTKMPKAVGLFLHAYALLATRARAEGDVAGEAAYLRRCEPLVGWLQEHAVPGYAGPAWNFGFNYKFLFDKPTVVITAMVARGLFAYHRLTGREDVLRMLRGACDFVLEDLLVTETDYGISFSYTPKDNVQRPKMLDCCYNASMLGAEVLAMGYALTGEGELEARARRAVDFTVHHQQEDGRWNYSVDLETGRERPQVDFHQGFILDSLHAFAELTEAPDQKYKAAIARGADFYLREQFSGDGRARWRLPADWPADVHCQAQGVITFSKLAGYDPRYLPFARRIAGWAIRNMQGRDGAFHYRKGRAITNRIPYMRWGQAWMMLAMAEFLWQASRRSEGPNGAGPGGDGSLLEQQRPSMR